MKESVLGEGGDYVPSINFKYINDVFHKMVIF